MKPKFFAKCVAAYVLSGVMVLSIMSQNCLAAVPVKLTQKSVVLTIAADNGKKTYGSSAIKMKTTNDTTVVKTTYKAADKNIATVSQKGKVTAKKAGQTWVTVTVKYRQKKMTRTRKMKYRVTVKEKKTSEQKVTKTNTPVPSSAARTNTPAPSGAARTTTPAAGSATQTSAPKQDNTAPTGVTDMENPTPTGTIPSLNVGESDGDTSQDGSHSDDTETPGTSSVIGQPSNVYQGSNVEQQNYTRWSSTIKSYLSYQEDGSFMRVQADAVEDGYLVEYYDSSYQLTDTKIISQELPLFGGFYEMEDYYCILSGQSNPDESDDVEVYRVTKYDKSWNKMDSCGLYGANTYIPFEAGSARMTAYGNYLLIRTCHEMYQTSDGYHHQANVTIQADMEKMNIVDAFYTVYNSSVGYVSHSFNQFIQVEDGKLVTVDHGDAYPRSIALIKYPLEVTEDGFMSNKKNCDVTDLIAFQGDTGANYTGASIGGFEISDSAYLVAGNQDIEYGYVSKGRNIFIASQSKEDGTVTVNTITDYTSGTDTTDTPQFIRIADNRYLLLWHRGDTVYYTEIDGDGNQVGEISSLKGDLSDCVPVVAGDKVVWYTWNNETVQFYEIGIS
jgi:hypothetical protein